MSCLLIIIVICAISRITLPQDQIISHEALSNFPGHEVNDAENVSKLNWESVILPKDVSNPCDNGAILLYSNLQNAYKCACPIGYEGQNCQIRSRICQELKDPCKAYEDAFAKAQCRAVQGNGFVCYHLQAHRDRWCFDSVENITQPCPNGWTCLDHLAEGKQGFRCLPPGQVVPPIASRMILVENECKNGGWRHWSGVCICLQHFTGPHCESVIDHCDSNPCPSDNSCETFLGGYKCKCPTFRAGPNCKEIKRRAVVTMDEPYFFYHADQYASVPSVYLYCVRELGVLPRVVINYDDGISMEMVQKDFKSIERLNDLLISLQYEPIEEADTITFMINRTHTYRKKGIYNASLTAWNKQLVVVRTNFTINVLEPKDCRFQIELKNSARTPDNATVYHRKDNIDIYSSSTVTCVNTRLKFSWELFAVPSLLAISRSAMRKRTAQHVLTNTSEYHVQPFTLTYGKYVLSLTVTMVEPVSGRNETIVTWFQIVKDKIVAHIFGGSLWYVHKTESFEINAQESYDSNSFSTNSLQFEWYCSVETPDHAVPEFCEDDSKPISTKSVLNVGANLLLLGGIYTFRTSVHSTTYEKAVQSVKIQVVPADVELVQIQCIQNCLGNTVVNTRPMALRAVYKNDRDKMNVTWECTRASDSQIPSLENEKSFTTNSNDFLMHAYALLPGQRYKITVIAKNAIVKNRKPGMATLEFVTVPKFLTGICNVVPSQGYALTTSFSIKCYNFFSHNLPILYEVFQYLLPRQEPTMVCFEISPNIADIKLAEGLPEADYNTNVVIRVADSAGIVQSYSRNVTVFPAASYANLKREIAIIKALALGTSSAVARDITEGNVQSVVQKVITTSHSLRTSLERVDGKLRQTRLLDEDAEDILERRHVVDIVNHFRYTMVEYLFHCELQTPVMIKYVGSALTSILEIQTSDVLSQANARAVMILNKMLKVLISRNMSRMDALDIGVGILSSVSLLMKEPEVHQVSKKYARRSFKEFSYEDVFKNDEVPFNLEEQERLLVKQHEETMEILNKYVSILTGHMAPYEKLEIASPTKDICLMIQEANPGVTMIKVNYVEANLTIPIDHMRRSKTYKLEVIYLKDNPYWWKEDSKEITFPVVSINVYDAQSLEQVSNSSAVTGANFRFAMPEDERRFSRHKIIEGIVRVLPSWNYTDQDISVHKLEVQTGGKLILVFDDRKDNVLLRIVVKKYRPLFEDFYETNVVPRFSDKNATDLERRSIYVDVKEELKRSVFYYVGILPHQITVRSLLPDIDIPISDDLLFNDPPPKPKDSTENASIVYSFKAYSIHCFRWNRFESEKTHCKVLEEITTETSLGCSCKGLSTVTASFRDAIHNVTSHSRFTLFIQFIENEIIPWFVLYVVICFLGLFSWAATCDRWDKKQQKIVMLEDNDDLDQYCYVVIVYTGRNMDCTTSSKVAIMLEGSKGNSSIHVLQSPKRRVMLRGAKDHFVIRTRHSLGDVFCLHMWHNHKGSRPTWYVAKVIVHDVQTHFVSIFITESWLAPFSGDGSLGLSCYRMLEFERLSWWTRYESAIEETVDVGAHGWVSMFVRQPARYNTRRRRVVVGLVHACLLMACVTEFYPTSQTRNPSEQMDKLGEFRYDWEEIIIGILAAMMAFPVNFGLFWITRNVAPTQSYAANYSSRYVEEIVVNMPSSSSIPKIPDARRSSMKQVLEPNELYTADKTPVLRKHTVPLRLPDDRKERIIYDELISQTKPIYGTPRLRRVFAFSHEFLHVIWPLLGTILLVSLYFVLTRGCFYSWTTGLRYLIATWTAFFTSFFILEPLKVMLMALWLVLKNKGYYVFEDRSQIIVYVTRELIPANKRKKRTRSIYRPPTIYKPVPRARLSNIEWNTLRRLSAKVFQVEMATMIVLATCLGLMQMSIYGHGTYYHRRNVRALFEGDHLYGETSLSGVKYMEDFLGYLEQTYLKCLYLEKSNNDELTTRTKDEVNYLVGSPRISQIRLRPDACSNDREKILHADCKHVDIRLDSDDRNFGESWVKLQGKPGMKDEDQPWLFKELGTVAGGYQYIVGNESVYPTGGYTVLLGVDGKKASVKFEYLKRTKWFDKYTRAIILEASVYNPNVKMASTVVILGERCYNGAFAVHRNIQFAKIRPTGDTEEIKLFLIIAVFFISLLLYSKGEASRLLASPKKYLFHISNLLSILLTTGGIAIVCTYAYRMAKILDAMKRLEDPSGSNFISFHDVIYAQNVFLAAIVCTLATVIIKFSSIVTARPKMYLLWNSLIGAAKSLIAATIMIFVLLASFAWFAFLIYGSGSWSYHRLDLAILSLFRIASSRTTDLVPLPTLNTWMSVHLAMLLIGGIFVGFHLIFHFLFVSIVINGYETTQLEMRKYRVEDIEKLRVIMKRYLKDNETGSSGGKMDQLVPGRRYAMHRILVAWITILRAEDDAESPEVVRSQAMMALVIDAFVKHRFERPPASEIKTNVNTAHQRLMATVLATALRLGQVLDHADRLNERFASLEVEATRQKRTRVKSTYDVPK